MEVQGGNQRTEEEAMVVHLGGMKQLRLSQQRGNNARLATPKNRFEQVVGLEGEIANLEDELQAIGVDERATLDYIEELRDKQERLREEILSFLNQDAMDEQARNEMLLLRNRKLAGQLEEELGALEVLLEDRRRRVLHLREQLERVDTEKVFLYLQTLGLAAPTSGTPSRAAEQ